MPHDTNTLSASLGHAAQAHTNSQPPLNCSNTADTVTMKWMQQSSDLVQQSSDLVQQDSDLVQQNSDLVQQNSARHE
jgi:hypothetical protein